jgi:RND family efflux transporter MFP subunit
MTNRPSLTDLASAAADNVPRPPVRWFTRFALPMSIICAALLVLLVTGWSAFVPARDVMVISTAVRPVETLVRTETSPTSTIQAPGWVEPDPFATYVAALEEGIIKEVLALEGDHIMKGQIIARLVDDEARIDVSKAQAELILARSAYRAEKAAEVAARQELKELVKSTRRIALARAENQRMIAQLQEFSALTRGSKAARDQLIDEINRKESLIDDGAVAEAVVVRLRLKAEAAQASLDGLYDQKMAKSAQVDATEAELTAALRDGELLIHEKLEAERASANVERSKAAVALAEAKLERSQLAFTRCEVVSPVDGVVIELLTSPGSTINFGNGVHGAHVLHVYNPEKLQVRADIPLSDASRVGVGQLAEIVVDLLPDKVFRGEITRFLHKADIQKNTVEAKIKIIDPSALLKPEMLARVRILPGRADSDGMEMVATVQRVFVPESAIVDLNGAPALWTVEDIDGERGRAIVSTIVLGEERNGDWLEVVNGILPGAKVILDGEGLSPGTSVHITEGDA